jgi:AraC-like DNA-binding protein
VVRQVHPPPLGDSETVLYEQVRRVLSEPRQVLWVFRSTVPLARVAADAGYADQSHFCRRFRRAYGIAPSA